MIVLTALSLPFMMREPIDLPPIVSVELIQISDKTNIPFAPKAKKTIEKRRPVIVLEVWRKRTNRLQKITILVEVLNLQEVLYLRLHPQHQEFL